MTSENQALDEKMPNVHELVHPLREEARIAHNVWVQRASFVVRPCSQAKKRVHADADPKHQRQLQLRYLNIK